MSLALLVDWLELIPLLVLSCRISEKKLKVKGER
jgi:hypothetical protein